MLEWGYLTSAVNESRPTVLRCNGTEVARLSRKVDGTWHATLNQHVPIGQPGRVYRNCQSFESGRAGVEAWAERHRDRLVREVAALDALRPARPWLAK